jgi:hypothetical protein
MIRQVLIALALTSAASAQEGLSTVDAQAQVTANAECQRSDYPHLATVIYACDRGLTFWYFTVPSENVPPGYIRRSIVVRDGSTYIETNGHYDGTDAQEADFFAWSRRLEAAILANSR